ncbi:hypothetical protein [Enterococcus mundtii]|uniref:hypothetical protein n=1 Tax=Enterococcus mundtii TaxID=53346 RepID=UPI001A969461|nr:hypothetical protein [Enterococcus mundtii]MBO1087241.1 hypothetical protein [Enterococcus mundtii]
MNDKFEISIIEDRQLSVAFLEEMYKSHKDGELNEFVLRTWDTFVVNILKGDRLRMDNIIEISSTLAQKDAYDKFNQFISDFLAGETTSISDYIEETPHISVEDINTWNEKMKKMENENIKLREEIARNADLVMEALDLMLN